MTVDLSVAAYAPLRRVALHGATGIHWESLLPGAATQMDTTLTIEVVHDDFVVLEVEADEQGWPELEFPPRALSSPVWIHTGTPWPRDPAQARSNADALEAFFDQAAVLRGFGSSADSLAAAVDILGAATAYEAMFDDPPAEFALLAPADGADVAGATTPLQWSESVSHDGEAVVYRVRVARDATFADLLVEEFTASNQFTLEAVSGPGSYHWQVEALEPGDPPTPATSGPRSVYLSGPVVAAPPAAPSAVPLELRGPGSDGFGASVSLRLARPMSVQLRWIDVRGREVARRALGHREAGTHVLYFPGHDGEGQPFARGVYWLIAEGGGARDVLRVVWLR